MADILDRRRPGSRLDELCLGREILAIPHASQNLESRLTTYLFGATSHTPRALFDGESLDGRQDRVSIIPLPPREWLHGLASHHTRACQTANLIRLCANLFLVNGV